MTPLKMFSMASTAMSVMGAIAEGNAKKAAHDYNAQVSERNAKVAENEAQSIYDAEQLQISKFLKEYDNLASAQSSAFRYNGWIAEGDTPLLVALASAAEADEEVAIRDLNARTGRQMNLEEGLQQKMNADLQTMYGKQAKKAAFFNAGSSLMGGYGNYQMIKALA